MQFTGCALCRSDRRRPVSLSRRSGRGAIRQRPCRGQNPRETAPAGSSRCRAAIWLGFQVLLDRQGFSPGQIDGKARRQFFARAGGAAGRRGSCRQRQARLRRRGRRSTGDDAEPTITTYTLTDGRRERPVRDEDSAHGSINRRSCAALGYQSALEELAERFHSSPALLQQLNPGLAIDSGHVDPGAGGDAVRSRRETGRAIAAAADVTIKVSRSGFVAARDARRRHARVLRAGHDRQRPRSAAARRLEGARRRAGIRSFHYNPDLFWDAKPTDEKATIKAGTEQSGRRRVDRAEPRALRSARHAGARATSATPNRTAACG